MTVNGRLRYVRKKLLCLTQAELASDSRHIILKKMQEIFN